MDENPGKFINNFAQRRTRRCAVVAAALDGFPVADGHLGKAVDGLMADGEASTRSLLGSGPGEGDLFGGPDFGGPGPFHPGAP